MPGLVISKLGIEASAHGDAVTGLLCLKVSSKDSDRSRRVLFNPSISLSQPEVCALPLSRPSHTSRLPASVAKAARLLNLPVGDTETKGQLPVVQVSSGQVSLSPRGANGDWLVILPFTAQVKRGATRQVSITLPKCLDNVIRFQIISDSSDLGEVSILTEPRMLPLPPFPDTDDDEGSWLEGRFQSTDNLLLEWSFGSSSASTLDISPHWHPSRPSIDVRYESTHAGRSTVPIETVIPEGWGWSSLAITGKGLTSWRSVDGDWWDETTFTDMLDSSDEEDSFSTIRQRGPGTPSRRPRPSITSPAYSSFSLLRQTMPSQLHEVDDFSFEGGSSTIESPRRPTPATPKSQTPIKSSRKQPIGGPAPARLFDLVVSGSSHGFLLEGTLVPLHLTLVRHYLCPPLPFVKIDDPSVSPLCEVSGGLLYESESTADTSQTYIGSVVWPNAPPAPPSHVDGDVHISLSKNVWGVVTASVSLPSARSEVQMRVHDADLRVISANADGTPIHRAVIREHDHTTVTLAPSQNPTIVLQLHGSKIHLPTLDGNGKTTVHLDDTFSHITTNMKRLDPCTYTAQHSSPSYLDFSAGKPGFRPQTLFSRTILYNLFILWLLVSMAQQVQRLRSEVAYIKEEAKDLRLYGLAAQTPPASPVQPEVWFEATTQTEPEAGSNAVEVRNDVGTSIGRVVFGRSLWDMLAVYPT